MLLQQRHAGCVERERERYEGLGLMLDMVICRLVRLLVAPFALSLPFPPPPLEPLLRSPGWNKAAKQREAGRKVSFCTVHSWGWPSDLADSQ